MKSLDTLKNCLVGLVLCLGLVQGSSHAQGGGVVFSEGTLQVLAKYLVVPNDKAVIDRDYKLGFNPRFGEEAVAFLQRPDTEEMDRAAALVAVGASGITGEEKMLEGLVRDGSPVIRRAALVAIGELKGKKSSFLISLLDDPELKGLAMIALLRGGSEAGRAEVLTRFREGGAESDILELVKFIDEPRDYVKVPPEVRTVYELRFQAARQFGLVDGQPWSVLIQGALMADQRFMDFVVFLAAADAPSVAVKDTILDRLLETSDLPSVFAAARAMPDELRALILSELWVPDSIQIWVVLFKELEARGAKLADLPLLELMEQQQLLTMGCQRLRAGLGDLEAQSKLRDALADSTSKVRAEAARGLGMSRNKEWVSDLERMGDDPAPEVVAAALIGRVQLGDGRAVSDLKEILANPEQTAQRTATVKALCSAASDNNVVSYIESAMLTSIGPEKLSVEVTLRMRGDLSIGQDLRNVLGDEVDLADRLFLVQALAENSAHEDLALFEDLFPSQRFPGVNLDLAIALARGGAPEGIDILRKALWSGPMDRSLLAASVLIQHGGLKSIVSELESTPLGVTADALRRVGYALGIFGGLDELDRLRRRRGTSDAALQGAYLGALAARTM